MKPRSRPAGRARPVAKGRRKPARQAAPHGLNPDEYVRIVPLHTPKPSVTPAEAAARDEGDPFDGKPSQSYCGYHSNDGAVYYAVMPHPTCNGCLGGQHAFDALTGISSHELCETITDPVPGKRWYDDKHGEIGDICAWNFKQAAGYTVQLESSNALRK